MTPRDKQRLQGVKPALVAVVELAEQHSLQRFMVGEGLRTQARQDELYAQGRTKPGPVVTWTRSSKHITGDAVDLFPLAPDGSVPWKSPAAFDAVAAAMFLAAAELGASIRWGADWDRDGKPRERGESDSPHFELV